MIIKKMRLSVAMVTLAGSMLVATPTMGTTDISAKTTTSTQKETTSQYNNRAVADVGANTTLNVRKSASTSSEIVGKLKKGNIATIQKAGSQWTKIKSGNVTGYVNNQYIVTGDEIETFAKENLKKKAKVTTESLRVRKKASTDSQIITLVSQGNQYDVKKETSNWVRISVNGQTGYLSKDYVRVHYSFGRGRTIKEIAAKEAAKKAAKLAKEKAALAKTTQNTVSQSETTNVGVTSVASSVSSKTVSQASTSTGSSIVAYAKQFVGNPYVYGGNSLTNGVDCSGFTQQVYAHFGYSISRTSSAQASNGVAVSTSDLQPGDLLFYSGDSGINHVAMYIGGGQVVHASNSAPYPQGGIKISSAFYRTPTCARRIL